ncbi:MAG: flavodoxin family protein [bacterium]
MLTKKKYKLIGISGSPRIKGTNYMIKIVLEATSHDYEMINLKDKKINPCTACGGCYKTHKCIVKDDMQEISNKLEEADAIVLGSPTYFANVTGIMKNFIDRCLPLYLREKLKNKRVALVTVGNFKKGEVRHLDNYDLEKAMKSPKGKKKVGETMQRCMNIMKVFCGKHMQMKVIGGVVAIGGDPTPEKGRLIKLGEKLLK